MQGFFVAGTFLIGLRHMLPGESSRGRVFDAFCPFGGVETLWAYVTTGQTLMTTNPLNFSVLLALLGVSLIAGRAFCGGWMCPIGTLQDMFAGWARRLSGGKKTNPRQEEQSAFPHTIPAPR